MNRRASARNGAAVKNLPALFAALALVAGCSCSGSVATGDAALPRDDGGSSDAGTGVDAPTTGDTGTSCAEPTAGSMTYTASCGAGSSGGFATQVAILIQPGGGARIRVTGRVPGARTPCDRWSSIDVVHAGTVIATLPANDAIVSTLGDGLTPWAEGPADPSVASLCDASGEADRFDGYGLVVHARTDGGTLTLTCGNGTGPGASFPPVVVMTCHRGLPPAIPDTYVRHTTGDDRTSLQAWFPDVPGTTVTAIDGNVRFLRGTRPFSPTLPPVDTTGWSFVAWTTAPPPPGGMPQRIFMAGANGNPLGADCPMSPIMGPDFPPVLIARVTGTTSAGPFASDLYAELCSSGM
jgi:hypothetical protein